MSRDDLISTALNVAWHRQTANASLERWLQLCEQEKWGEIPAKIDQLISVFGTSWYFTRFIFYRGRLSAELIDKPTLTRFDDESLLQFLSEALEGNDQDHQFDWLRSLKNQAMMLILLRRLSEMDSLEENEAAITRLATAVLTVAMKIVGLELDHPDDKIAVLGMGRISGFEMNYGSDLDLIFLYESNSESFHTFFSEKIRILLRNMSLLAPGGVLYDVDMRLRPHGTSGALITSVSSFLEYHKDEREIWERQMMTRCRPIIDNCGLGTRTMQEVLPCIYADTYDASISQEILSVRLRVQDELGSRRGKIDIKRGRGGIMDIDFLTHYLQLVNAHEYPDLKNPSTRAVLGVLSELGFLSENESNNLRNSYNFFKQIESCIRLFDMKSVNTFSKNLNDDDALIRAMRSGRHDTAVEFIEEYEKRSEDVNALFLHTLS